MSSTSCDILLYQCLRDENEDLDGDEDDDEQLQVCDNQESGTRPNNPHIMERPLPH